MIDSTMQCNGNLELLSENVIERVTADVMDVRRESHKIAIKLEGYNYLYYSYSHPPINATLQLVSFGSILEPKTGP